MKIKTSELIGPPLDYAVALLEYPEPDYDRDDRLVYVTSGGDDGDSWVFSPSTNWSQGGPILERTITKLEDYGDTWGAEGPDAPEHYGPTALIAANRCYVASQLGDEVDIPEELCA